MSIRSVLLLLMLALSACDSSSLPPALGGDSDTGKKLDERAIAAGILPDPDDIVFSGRFETRSDLGTDKFCAIKQNSKSYRVGVIAVFGPDSKCEGQGTANFDGEKVQINLSGKKPCSIPAIFDGVSLQFGGAISEGCESFCNGKGSFAGTSYYMVEQGDDAARRVLGRDVNNLCS